MFRCFLGLLLLTFAALPAWGQELPPGTFLVCTEPEGDADCASLNVAEIDPQGRELWLRKTITTDRYTNLDEEPYALIIVAMAASDVYWNGALIGRNGRPGPDRESEIPGQMDWALYLRDDLIAEGSNELVIHMSSHHNPTRVVRPVHIIGIGPHANSVSWRVTYYLPALLTAGGLLLAAVYFATWFGLNRREIGAALLAALSLCVVGQLGFEIIRGLITYSYPWHVPRLWAVAIFAGGFAVTLTGYVTLRINRRWMLRAVLAAAGLATLAVLLSPSFDLKAFLAILVGCVASLGIVALNTRRLTIEGWAIGAGLVIFFAVMLLRGALFLDLDFYLMAFALLSVLFISELVVRRREQVAAAAVNERAKALETELLRRRMSPHFLMNTLNTLSAWVGHDTEKSHDIIEALATEMGEVERLSQFRLIALSDEIGLCQAHLWLLSYRAEQTCTLTVEGDPGGIRIPPATLLTIVENAFSHNRFAGAVTLALSIQRDNNTAELRLACPLSPKPGDAASGGGLGREYIETRLRDAFGASTWRFNEGADGATWVTTMAIPLLP